MSTRSLIILLALTAGIAAGLWMLAAEEPAAERPHELFLPGLKAGLNDVERVAVSGAGREPIATLIRDENRWRVEEKAGYPADIGRLRRILIELSEAEIVERKTARPENHPRLGVEDIASPDASGVLLEIHAGDAVHSVIVGNGASASMTYVRRPDDPQSLMISADLDPGNKTMDWVDRSLIDIPSAGVRRVTITHPGPGSLKIEKATRADTTHELLDVPAGKKLEFSGAANSVAAAMAGLEFDDVRSAADWKPAGEPVVARYETFDGLTVEVRAWQTENGTRVTLSAQAETDEMRMRASELNERVNGWVYTLPAYKAEQLVKRKDDLLTDADG